jgi:hypothetical protein
MVNMKYETPTSEMHAIPPCTITLYRKYEKPTSEMHAILYNIALYGKYETPTSEMLAPSIKEKNI